MSEADVTDPEAPGAAQSPELSYGVPVTVSHGATVLHPSREQYHDLAASLQADGFAMCVDLTVVDYLDSDCRSLPDGVDADRFEVVAGFLDLDQRRRVRVRVQVGADETSIATLTDLYPGAEALEREAFDMFGVSFENHPDPTRILMPEDWEGFPLRKDYDIGRIPVQFKSPGQSGIGR